MGKCSKFLDLVDAKSIAAGVDLERTQAINFAILLQAVMNVSKVSLSILSWVSNLSPKAFTFFQCERWFLKLDFSNASCRSVNSSLKTI